MVLLPTKLSSSVKIARGPVSLAPPVVAGDSVFLGCEATDIVRLDWPRLDPVWRIPANDFSAESVSGDILVLAAMRALRYRGVHLTGETAWTLEPQAGSTPWFRWGHRIFCNNPGIFVADVKTGSVIEHHAVPSGAIRAGGLIDPDLYLYSTTDQPEVTRIYDLPRRQVVWERDLRVEARSVYGVSDAHVGVLSGSAWNEILVGKSERHLFGLARENGAFLWHKPFWSPNGALGFDEGRIYAWTSVQEDPQADRLICLDVRTGGVVYDIPHKRYGGEVAASYLPTRPSIDNGYVAFGTRSGLLAVFRLSDGELVWSYKYKSEVYQPVLAGDRLLVTAADGRLLVFEGKSSPR